MSPLFTRALFASASIALTLAMVSASAPATAAALQPAAIQITAPTAR